VVRLRSHKRLAGVAFAFAAAVLALAATAWALQDGESSQRGRIIKGTNRADALTGTRRNDILEGLGGADRLRGLRGQDRLYAGAGNDRLSGGRGADKLMGGPGADVIRCGGGKDVVYADNADRVAKDCEVVHGRALQLPPNGLAGPGLYRGGNIRLRVQPDGRTIVNLRLDYAGSCPPRGGSSQISIADTGPWGIQADRTFAIEENDAGSTHLKLNGGFNGETAAGSFQLQPTDDGGGVECDTGTVGWTAKLQK
jgi:Ca2+-binding RTX toxin-like protein